jgi:hypothetical protein
MRMHGIECWRGGLVALAIVALIAGGEARAYTPRSEVVLEGGATVPLGDLAEDYFGTEKGFGAETGYGIGFGYRYRITPEWSLGPTFMFTEFGAFTGVSEASGELKVTGSALRYGLDVQYTAPGDRDRVRPFARLGLALYHDRIKQEALELGEFYEEAVNTLGVTLGGGLRLGSFELGAHYHLNRFETAKFNFVSFPERLDFDWDFVSVQVGFVLATE